MRLKSLVGGSATSRWSVRQSNTSRASNPADFANPAFEFSAKQLGFREGRAWDYLRQSMARYGLSLEQTARDATLLRQADPAAPILSRDHYRALAAQAQNEVTLESGITTRMPGLMTNPVLNLANPLLGWAIDKGLRRLARFPGTQRPEDRQGRHDRAAGLRCHLAHRPGLRPDARQIR